MKINFDHIDLSFENIEGNDERLKRISHLIWKLLDEKFENDDETTNRKYSLDTVRKVNTITLDEIVVTPIHVNSSKSEYEIASSCASEIHRAILMRLQ